MLKSIALAGAIALNLMALPAQAAITIFEGASVNAPTWSRPIVDLSGLSFVSIDVGDAVTPSVDIADAGRTPLMITDPGSAAPFELPRVPEPATWGMILAGLGTIGYTMRRQGSLNVSFA